MPPTPYTLIVMEESRSKIVTRSSRRLEKVALALSDSKKVSYSQQQKVLEGRIVTGSDYSVETWMRLREGTNWMNESEFANVEKFLLNRGQLSLEKSLCITLLQAQKVSTSWARPRELFALNQPSENDTTPSTPRSATNDCPFTAAADMKCPMSEELAFWKRLREKLSKLNPETAADFCELPKHQFSAENIVVLPPFSGLMPEGLPSEQRSLDIWKNENENDVTIFQGKEGNEKTAAKSHQTNNTNKKPASGRNSQEDVITAAGLMEKITWEELNEKFEEVEKLLAGVFQQASDYLQTFDVLSKSILAIAETGMINWLKMEPQEIMEALRTQANVITQAAWSSSNPETANKSEILSLGVSSDGFLEQWKRLRETGDVSKDSKVKANLTTSEKKVSQKPEETGKLTLGSGKEKPTEEFHRVRELFIQAFTEGLFSIQVNNVKYVSKHLRESVISRALTVDITDLSKWMETENMEEIVKGEKIEVTNKNRSANVQSENMSNECLFKKTLERKIVESVGSIQKLVCYFLDENENALSKKIKKEIINNDEEYEVRLSGYFPKEKYPKSSKTSESKQNEFSMRDWLKTNQQQQSGCPLDKLIEWLKTEGEIFASEKSFSENSEQKSGPNMKCKLEKKMYLAAAAYGFIEWLLGNVEALGSAVFEHADVVRHIEKLLNLEIEHVNKGDKILLGCKKDNSTIPWTRLRESWKSNEAVKAIIEEEKTRLSLMQKPGKTLNNMLALSHEASSEIYHRPRELFLQAFMEGKLEMHVNGTPFAADKLTKIVLSRALNCDFSSIEKWFKTEEMKKNEYSRDGSKICSLQLLKKDTLPNYCEYKSSLKHESILGKSFSRKVLLYMLDVTLSYSEVNKKTERQQKRVQFQNKNNETIVVFGQNLRYRMITTIDKTENVDGNTEMIVVYGSGMRVRTKTTVSQEVKFTEETETIVIYGRNLKFRTKPTIDEKKIAHDDTETIIIYGKKLRVTSKTTTVQTTRFEEETETIVIYGDKLKFENKESNTAIHTQDGGDTTETIVVYGRKLNIGSKTRIDHGHITEKETNTIVVHGTNLHVRIKTTDIQQKDTEDIKTKDVSSTTKSIRSRKTISKKEHVENDTECIVVYGTNLTMRVQNKEDIHNNPIITICTTDKDLKNTSVEVNFESIDQDEILTVDCGNLFLENSLSEERDQRVEDNNNNPEEIIKLPAKLDLPKTPKAEKPNVSFEKDFSVQNLLKYFSNSSTAICLEDFINWFTESSHISPSTTNSAEKTDAASGPRSKYEAEKVLLSAVASFGFIEWLFGNIEHLEPTVFEYADVVRHISKVINSALDQITQNPAIQLCCEEENALIAWTRLRESIKSSEGVKLLLQTDNSRSSFLQEPKLEPNKLLGKPCEALPYGYFRPREMFVDAFTQGKVEPHEDCSPYSANLSSKLVLSRALKKEFEELEKLLNISTFTEWQGKPAFKKSKMLASQEILANRCSNTTELLYEKVLGKSFTKNLLTYILDANLSAEEKKKVIEEADGVIRLPGKLSLKKYSEPKKLNEQFQENFSLRNLLTYVTNSTTALSFNSFIEWVGVSSQISPVQKKSAERTDLVSGPTAKCNVETNLFLAAASFGFIEWLFGDVEVLKDALFVYAELLKQISELLPASCGRVLTGVIKLAREEKDAELLWMRLREKEANRLTCKTDLEEQPVSVAGRIIGSNYKDASTNGRAREEVMEDYARIREMVISDFNQCSLSEEKGTLNLEDKIHEIVALGYGLGLNEELSTIWNDLNSLKSLATKVPTEVSTISFSEEKLNELKKPKEEDILERILNGLGKINGGVKFLEAEENVEVVEFMTMPIEEQLLMREKQSKPFPSKQFSEALAQIECQCFESASATDVLTKQEMIAELVQNLYGGLKVSKETGAEKEGRYASKVAGSFQNAACFTTHTNSWSMTKPENRMLNASLSVSYSEESLDKLEAEGYLDVADDMSKKQEIERLERLHAAKYAELVEFFIKEKFLDSGKWFDNVDDLFLDLPSAGSETFVFHDHETAPDDVKMTLNRCNMSEESKSNEIPLKKAKSLEDWQSADVMSVESIENSDWLAKDLVENVPDYLLVASGKDDYINLFTCEEKSYGNETNALEAFSENCLSRDEQFNETEAVFTGIAKSEEVEYKIGKEDLQAVETLSLPFEKKLMSAEISNRFNQMSIQSSEAIAEHELRLIQTALLSSDDVSKYELALCPGSDSSSDTYELSVSDLDEWLPMNEDGIDTGSDNQLKWTRQSRNRELIGVAMSSRHTKMWSDMDLAMHLTHCDPQNADEVNETIADDQKIAETSSTSIKNEMCPNIFKSRSDMDLAMHLTHCDPQNADEVNETIADDQKIAETSSTSIKNEMCPNIFKSRSDMDLAMHLTHCDPQNADEVNETIADDQKIAEISSTSIKNEMCPNIFKSRSDMDLAMHLTHCDPQNAYEVNEAFADDQRIAETSSIFVKNEISQQIFNSWDDLSQQSSVVHCDQQIRNDINEDIAEDQHLATLNSMSAKDDICRSNLEENKPAVKLVFLFITTTSEEHSREELLRFDAEEWTFPDIRFHDTIFEIALSVKTPEVLSNFVATDEQDLEIDEQIYQKIPCTQENGVAFLNDGEEDELQSDTEIETDEEIVPEEVKEVQQPTNRSRPVLVIEEAEEIDEERITPQTVKEQQNPIHRFMSHLYDENASTFTGSFDIADESYSSVFAIESESEEEWEYADEGKKDFPPSPPVLEDEHCDESSVPVQTPARVQLGFKEDEMDVITRQSVPQAIFEVRAEIPVAYDQEKDKYIYDIKTESFKIDPAVINNMTIKVTRDSAKQKTEALARAERRENDSSASTGVEAAAINNMTIKVTRDSSRHKLEALALSQREVSEVSSVRAISPKLPVDPASINSMTVTVTRDSSRHKLKAENLREREMSEGSIVGALSPKIPVDPASINNMTIKVTRDTSRHKMESLSNGKLNCNSHATSKSSNIDLVDSEYRKLKSEIGSESIGHLSGFCSEECKKDAANINNMTIKVTRKSHKQKQELRNVKVEHYYDDVISGEYHLDHGFNKKWKSGLMENGQNGTVEDLFMDHMGYIVPPSTKMNVCVSRKHYNKGSQEMKRKKFRSRSRSLPREQEIEHA